MGDCTGKSWQSKQKKKKRKRGRNANVTILLMISTLKSLINPVTKPETEPGDSVPGFSKIVPSFNKELCHRWQ